MSPPDLPEPSYGDIAISTADVRFLVQAVREAAGARAAEDVLFRIGRRFGETQAAHLGSLADDEARLRSGFARLPRLGLGDVSVADLELREDGCRITGMLFDAIEAGLSPSGEDHGGACGLTLGFLTGLVAATTGHDVVCRPVGGPIQGSRARCRFEIHPAHAGEPEGGDAAPSGSARFFLGSMGRGIAESDISLDALLEKTTDAIILLDGQDVIRFWNRGAEELFQYPRAEVVGRPAGFILPTDLRHTDELGWIRQRLARGESLENHVTRRIRRDGSEVHVSLTRTPLRDSHGKTVGSTAVIRDITSQRRTEAELARARTLAVVGELAAKIAHEVKNPLAGIHAAVQAVARGFDETDPRREVFDDVSKEIHRLDETVQDLLSFARPVPLKPRPTNLRTFLADLLETLLHQPQLEPHRIELGVPGGLVVEADPRLLGQVFNNLVLNAAQAMEQPGEIRIGARPGPEGKVTVEVADTGPGIPEEELESVFEPFFTTRVRGTGLGLSIARKNVQAHEGILTVRSEPGEGAVFTLTLPLAGRSGSGSY